MKSVDVNGAAKWTWDSTLSGIPANCAVTYYKHDASEPDTNNCGVESGANQYCKPGVNGTAGCNPVADLTALKALFYNWQYNDGVMTHTNTFQSYHDHDTNADTPKIPGGSAAIKIQYYSMQYKCTTSA